VSSDCVGLKAAAPTSVAVIKGIQRHETQLQKKLLWEIFFCVLEGNVLYDDGSLDDAGDALGGGLGFIVGDWPQIFRGMCEGKYCTRVQPYAAFKYYSACQQVLQ
jgi:hypothetical protein